MTFVYALIPTVKQLMNQLVQNCCWLETTAEWFIKVTSWVQLMWIDRPYIALLDAQRLNYWGSWTRATRQQRRVSQLVPIWRRWFTDTTVQATTKHYWSKLEKNLAAQLTVCMLTYHIMWCHYIDIISLVVTKSPH